MYKLIAVESTKHNKDNEAQGDSLWNMLFYIAKLWTYPTTVMIIATSICQSTTIKLFVLKDAYK